MSGVNGDTKYSQRDRGANVVIGLVLLFAMVIAGSTLVFLVGSPMFDALQSQADREKVSMCMDESDHRLSTVAKTGREQSMAFEDPDCQAEVVEGGTITITKYDGSTEDPPWDDETRVASADLDAYEFELDDWTVAHQGGGIWELSDGEVSVDKAPAVGFDSDDSIQLDLMRLKHAADGDGSISRARNDPAAATDTTERFAEIAGDPTYDDFAIRIESEYADGWERHFEREAEGASGWDVSVERPGENVVVLKAEDVEGEADTGHFLIDGDRGLITQSGKSIDDNLVENGDKFYVDATLTNYRAAESRVTANISIWNESGTVERQTITSKEPLEKGASIRTADQEEWVGGHAFFDTRSSGKKSIDLSPGNEYSYTIETDPGGDTLDTHGSLYYLHEGVHYAVADTWTNDSDGVITVSADVRNLGSESADGPRDVTLAISPDNGDNVTTSTELELESGQSGTVTWTINESDWPNGDYEYDIAVPGDAVGGEFEVTEGGAFVISEDLGIPDGDRADGADGHVVSEEDAVTIGANITNTHLSERTQNVTLHVLDEEGMTVGRTETTLTLGGGETARANLTVDPLEAGSVYEYNVSTEDDDLDTRGSFLVVEEPSQFAIEAVDVVDDPVKPRESVTVDVTVGNRGDADTQFVWLEGFDGSVVAIDELELERDEERTVTLEWGSVEIPGSSDDTAITAGTGTDSATADVDIDPLLEVNDVTVVEKEVTDERTVSSGGWWYRNEDVVGKTLELTIEAELESVAGDADQTVVLEGFDGDPVETDVTVPAGTTETVTFEYETPDNSVTDRITVRTEDDEMDEVVIVERDGPACGEVSYDGSGTATDPYRVSDVDQLQCIDEHELDADYELVDDIDAHGTKYWNDGAGFQPIGDQTRGGSEFAGDFDGNGHAIRGLHIDRPNEDFVGLFAVNSYFDDTDPGVGEGSKIHNLRLENVSVHGRQVTGGLIGAAGGVIENVRVSGTVEAEYQEVGGIAGSSHNADLDNRLVSAAAVRGGLPAAATDEVDHPWGANNMGIGGIVGSTGWNTEVSTAYSQADVEGPFGVGGIVGWTSDYASTNEQMYWAEGEITVTADRYEHDPEHYLNEMGRRSYGANTGGAIFGRGDDESDEFHDSVYYNEEHHERPFGEHVIGERIDVNDRNTDEMHGLDATDVGNLGHLDYEGEGGPWVALPDDYPRFAWELAAEGQFDVEIDDVENVTAGEAAEVDVTVTSRYEDGDESDVTQTIALTDTEGRTVDTRSVTLPSTLGEDERTEITLVWQTAGDDGGTGNVTVRSEEMSDSAPITVAPAEHGTGSSDGPVRNLTLDSDVTESESDYGPGESDSSEDDVPDVGSEIDVDVAVVEVN